MRCRDISDAPCTPPGRRHRAHDPIGQRRVHRRWTTRRSGRRGGSRPCAARPPGRSRRPHGCGGGPATREGAGAARARRARAAAPMRRARYAASSSTQPSSADPRVPPRQAKEAQAGGRGDAPVVYEVPVTVEHRRIDPRAVEHEAVAQTTVPGCSVAPSLKVTSGPETSTVRPRRWMPCRRRAVRGLDPISVSRSCMHRPIRKFAVLLMRRVASRLASGLDSLLMVSAPARP